MVILPVKEQKKLVQTLRQKYRLQVMSCTFPANRRSVDSLKLSTDAVAARMIFILVSADALMYHPVPLPEMPYCALPWCCSVFFSNFSGSLIVSSVRNVRQEMLAINTNT